MNRVEYWLDLADYDLASAKAMLETKRFLYLGFLCHQVIEKDLKAYFWHTKKKEPPFTHNLLILSKQSNFDTESNQDFIDLFTELMPLNIQARYPEDKELLLKTLKNKKCQELFQRTKDFHKWIKKLLK